MVKRAPIEEYFPVEKVNEIADKEGQGSARKYYRPTLYMHKWWAKRLSSVFRSILLYTLYENNIKHGNKLLDIGESGYNSIWNFYLEDVDFSDKIVLDPFFGGGTTLLEALKMKCNVVGSELNPVAWFSVKKMFDDVDVEKLENEFNKLERNIKSELNKYHKTKCKICRNEVNAVYFFWVKEINCLNCDEKIPLFGDYLFASSISSKDSHYWVLCPGCGNLFKENDYRKEVNCPECNNIFTPSEEGASTGTFYTCPSCGQRERIIKNIEENGRPEERMYAIEYYCEECDKNKRLPNGRGYKDVEKFDLDLLNDARQEYKENKEKYQFPKQKIPQGKETTPRLPNHGYKYFKDMFNERQLLNLGKLLNEIENIDNQNIKEFFLLAFSNCLDFNNMLCKYDRAKSSSNGIKNLFATHSFHPKALPVENNVFGVEKGAGSFKNSFKDVLKGKQFCHNTYEKYIDKGKTKTKQTSNKIIVDFANDFEELSKNNNVMLLCGDSSYLPIPNNSVDAVVTDPPYYDNVMYSELSDFFYVWLRLSLKNEYEHFNSKYTPKSSEVVKNRVRNKSEEDFADGLSNVFRECNKKLKEEGLMVFTFHHGDTDAWSSVLKSVLDSNFYVSAIYPISSEMRTSKHIFEKGNIEYDMIVVCRKKEDDPERGLWNKMEDQIYIEAKKEVEKLKSEGKSLTQGDVFVITIGKCLEIYSKHYPNVIKDGERVDVKEALESITSIVETQVMGGMFNQLTEDLDLISAAYITYIAGMGGEKSYSNLNKNMKQRSIDISDLVDSGIVKKDGSKIVVPELKELAYNIDEKPESKLTAIDRAYYLIYLQEKDKLMEEMRYWATDKALIALERLSEKENKKEYKKLADFVREKIKDKSLDNY